MPADLMQTFTALRGALAKYARHFVVKHDEPGHYYLDTVSYGKSKCPIGFACVAARKDKVTLYLMPAYVFPDVMAGASPALEKARSGKSCFHFKTVEPATLKEIESILADSFAKYKKAGLLEATMYVPPADAVCEPFDKKTAAKLATSAAERAGKTAGKSTKKATGKKAAKKARRKA